MKGTNLDVVSGGGETPRRPISDMQRSLEGRPFLGVHFACCDIYRRVYLDANQTGYTGRCPKCGQTVRFQIGEGGTPARFFRAE